MEEKKRDKLIQNLIANLPALRATLHLTQSDLAKMLGISRQQIVAIENKARKMKWSTFLAAVLIFRSNEDTDRLLSVFEIYTKELEEFIKNKGKRNTDSECIE